MRIREVRIGARGSKLSLVQANIVASALNNVGIQTGIVKISTKGDFDRVSPMYEIGSTGIFVEELNNRILAGEIDVAVHSAKDIPSKLQEGIEIAAVMPRSTPWDALVSNRTLDQLPSGSVIGTSSLRRKMEVLSIRNDLRVENIRGNVDTRIGKLNTGEYDGIVLAVAALERIGFKGEYHILDGRTFVPAPNQGFIAATSAGGEELSNIMRRIDDPMSRKCLQNERRVMEELNMGCSVPMGVYCSPGHEMWARIFSRDGKQDQYLEGDAKEDASLRDFIHRAGKSKQELGY